MINWPAFIIAIVISFLIISGLMLTGIKSCIHEIKIFYKWMKNYF